MNKLTWRFWLLFIGLATGAHLVFGSGWGQPVRGERSCGCLIELDGSSPSRAKLSPCPAGSAPEASPAPGSDLFQAALRLATE